MKKTEAISILATSVRPREPKDRARYDEAVKMAIEALKCSETPKSSERTAKIAQDVKDGDLISRKAAIDCVTYDEEYTIECLKVLPSAQPEPHWIPCSKRLPEDGRCLVTRYDSVTNTCFSDILWYEKGVWWNRLCIGDFAVIAWMPLPEPYKGGETE